MIKTYVRKDNPSVKVQAFQVPKRGEQPSEADIAWLDALPREYSGDDDGIVLHGYSEGISVLVCPGDFIARDMGNGEAFAVRRHTFLKDYNQTEPDKTNYQEHIEQSMSDLRNQPKVTRTIKGTSYLAALDELDEMKADPAPPSTITPAQLVAELTSQAAQLPQRYQLELIGALIAEMQGDERKY